MLLSIAMLAAFCLIAGGGWLVAKDRDRTKGVLMIVAAAVIVLNVAIWTV